ncbi:MAG: LysM peptidoglycan-binding domain-containing protein [Treponema sp.]|nr:LysM peptidoglycan-binding domain-containing protein [Treponema sp.]
MKKTVLILLMAFAVCAGVFAQDLIHQVTRGETVYSISRLYQISQEELMRYNKLTDASRLQAGMRLAIPPKASSNPPVVSNPPAAPSSYSTYTVTKNDTLYSIARAKNVTLQALRDINGFSKNYTLKVGEKIKIPTPPVAAVTQNETEKDDYNKAIADYTEAIKISPNDFTAYRNRGIMYKAIKDYIKANSDFTQAIKLNPSEPDKRLNGTWEWVSQRSGDLESYEYKINNGTFQLTVTDKRTTSTRTMVTITTGQYYLKGTYIANNNIIVFIPTHFKINNTDWIEIKDDTDKKPVDTSNKSDEINEAIRLIEEWVASYNALGDPLILEAQQKSGDYSFSDNAIILGGTKYNKK